MSYGQSRMTGNDRSVATECTCAHWKGLIDVWVITVYMIMPYIFNQSLYKIYIKNLISYNLVNNFSKFLF